MLARTLHLSSRMSVPHLSQLRKLQEKLKKIGEENRNHFERQDGELASLSADLSNIIAACSGTDDNGPVASTKRSQAPLTDSFNSKKRRLHDETETVQPSKEKMIRNSDGYVVVHTDGACSNNGYSGAKAGIGIWWGENSPHNRSQPVAGGRHTNNTAEIQAATIAISQAKGLRISKLDVHTDSQFLINCITKWMPNWKRNNWMTADRKPVKNKEDLLALDQVLASGSVAVKWTHVRGHAGVRGNEEADRLARIGAQN